MPRDVHVHMSASYNVLHGYNASTVLWQIALSNGIGQMPKSETSRHADTQFDNVNISLQTKTGHQLSTTELHLHRRLNKQLPQEESIMSIANNNAVQTWNTWWTLIAIQGQLFNWWCHFRFATPPIGWTIISLVIRFECWAPPLWKVKISANITVKYVGQLVQKFCKYIRGYCYPTPEP